MTELEKRLAEGAEGPKITLEQVEDTIASCMFSRPEGTNMTLCVARLKNGYTVTGESACVSAENFDEELGAQMAYRKALDKIWGLEGYRLACELSK